MYAMTISDSIKVVSNVLRVKEFAGYAVETRYEMLKDSPQPHCSAIEVSY